MTTSSTRAVATAVACIAALALTAGSLLAGCSGSSSPGEPTSGPAQPAVTRIELRFAGGSVVGGVGRQGVPLGSTVELVVSSDVADEVHLHGYDKKLDVPAGRTATLGFVANVPGAFEVELESRGMPLTRLEVR